MKSGSTHRLPFQRHIERVVGKMRHLIIIALIQTDAFAVLEVNRRYNFDGKTPLMFLNYQDKIYYL